MCRCTLEIIQFSLSFFTTSAPFRVDCSSAALRHTQSYFLPSLFGFHCVPLYLIFFWSFLSHLLRSSSLSCTYLLLSSHKLLSFIFILTHILRSQIKINSILRLLVLSSKFSIQYMILAFFLFARVTARPRQSFFCDMTFQFAPVFWHLHSKRSGIRMYGKTRNASINLYLADNSSLMARDAFTAMFLVLLSSRGQHQCQSIQL